MKSFKHTFTKTTDIYIQLYPFFHYLQLFTTIFRMVYYTPLHWPFYRYKGKYKCTTYAFGSCQNQLFPIIVELNTNIHHKTWFSCPHFVICRTACLLMVHAIKWALVYAFLVRMWQLFTKGTFVDANIPYTETKFIFNTFPSHLDGWFFLWSEKQLLQ